MQPSAWLSDAVQGCIAGTVHGCIAGTDHGCTSCLQKMGQYHWHMCKRMIETVVPTLCGCPGWSGTKHTHQEQHQSLNQSATQSRVDIQQDVGCPYRLTHADIFALTKAQAGHLVALAQHASTSLLQGSRPSNAPVDAMNCKNSSGCECVNVSAQFERVGCRS